MENRSIRASKEIIKRSNASCIKISSEFDVIGSYWSERWALMELSAMRMPSHYLIA
jgi:hypothetical protein